VKDDELQRVNAALSKLQVEVVRAVIVERGAKAAWDHYVATYEPDASVDGDRPVLWDEIIDADTEEAKEWTRMNARAVLSAVGFFDLLAAAEEVEVCDGVTVGGLDRLRDAIRRAKEGQ